MSTFLYNKHKGGSFMAQKGRPKGTENRKWTPEKKEQIVKRYLEGTISRRALTKEERISDSLLHKWIQKYQESGFDGLVSRTGNRGNSYMALYISKDLPEIKRLQLQIAQLQVEVERLKKGYVVKGVGVDKEFVSTKNLNSR
jgi:transposase-like protein